MSQLPPPLPDDFPGQQPLNYFPPAGNNAPALVRLAVIFNYVSAGLDLCLFLLGAGLSVLFLSGVVPMDPGDPPPMLLGVIYIFVAVLALATAIIKFVGTRKVSRGGPGAWGWGLAVGILGCVQIVTGNCICLQVAAGVYTIVIVCFSDVKAYLATGIQAQDTQSI